MQIIYIYVYIFIKNTLMYNKNNKKQEDKCILTLADFQQVVLQVTKSLFHMGRQHLAHVGSAPRQESLPGFTDSRPGHQIVPSVGADAASLFKSGAAQEAWNW